ncbi:predicted protein [Histoplasma capsulatum G186AR]|uniref:Uncharacterized protein n=1 Tax=Ajellomyces capsulatus (strain G186AR / H82 / ATCC MYA-2454 / RMSCC 2432) TaxID=447093 RepID=C0NEV7_AJECG|nr:uncharacterized protein HCBG_01423 [Histoplasma capsulatum G186AR]EEH09778.1 predicted protein [Histoplasma capsulatum G186AR]
MYDFLTHDPPHLKPQKWDICPVIHRLLDKAEILLIVFVFHDICTQMLKPRRFLERWGPTNAKSKQRRIIVPHSLHLANCKLGVMIASDGANDGHSFTKAGRKCPGLPHPKKAGKFDPM